MVFSSLVCFISLNWLTLTFNYIGHSSYQPLFEELLHLSCNSFCAFRIFLAITQFSFYILSTRSYLCCVYLMLFLLAMSIIPCYRAQWRS